jgi:hypothetical protein
MSFELLFKKFRTFIELQLPKCFSLGSIDDDELRAC